MKSQIFAVAILCAAGACAQDTSAERAEGFPPGAAGTLQRGVAGYLGRAATSNLIDHGGRILPSSRIYYIWWGNQGAWPADTNSGLTILADGFNGSNFMKDIFPQYMRGSSVSTGFVESLYDSTTPPGHGPKTSAIATEACNMINAHGLTPDPAAVYVVLTSNFPKGVNYCAWHSYGSCNGTTIQVAYMPNTTGVAGCNDPVFTCNSYSQGTNSIANVLSHEFSEAITDPDLNAWYDSSGSEIGDKCAWTFQSCVNLTNSSWQLQMEWSNAISGCKQQ